MNAKEKIAHFVKHGDPNCQTCIDGMRLYMKNRDKIEQEA